MLWFVLFCVTEPAEAWGLWWGVLSELIGQEARCSHSLHLPRVSTQYSPHQLHDTGSAFTLNIKIWLLAWRSPSKRLFSPLLHSLCSHLFLHVGAVNCALIKTVPSTSISYWTIIIIVVTCTFLLLKVNWLCVSQGIYAGPSLEAGGQAVNEPPGFSLGAYHGDDSPLCDWSHVCYTHGLPDAFFAPSTDVVSE